MSEWLGSASVHLGYEKALDEIAPSGGAGGHAGWTAQLGWINPGFEIGRLGLVRPHAAHAAGGDSSVRRIRLYLGPIVCFGRHRHGSPYGLAGLGFYRWKAFDPQVLDPVRRGSADLDPRFPGRSIGGGVRLHATRTLSSS
jgi:hypothetical protein